MARQVSRAAVTGARGVASSWEGSGLEAAVEDADEAVGELTQRGLVADVAGAELLVVGGGPG